MGVNLDRQRLGERLPPRVLLKALWQVAPEALEEAQNDATVLALEDQHRAGVDIVTDGEMRRESYSNRFSNALDGVDIDNPGEALDRYRARWFRYPGLWARSAAAHRWRRAIYRFFGRIPTNC